MEELIRETMNNEKNISTEGAIVDILKNATQAKSKSTSRGAVEAGIMSIVNAKTGARITFVNTFLEQLRNPAKLQISYDKDKKIMIVGEQLLDNENSYAIRKSAGKGIIYAKSLVDEITEAMELDFSDRTSITFHEVEYLEDEEYSVAIIQLKEE